MKIATWRRMFVLALFALLVALGMRAGPASSEEPVPIPGSARAKDGDRSTSRNVLFVIVAGAFVGLYWLDRFNVPVRKKAGSTAEKERFLLPATNRSSTTTPRYYVAAGVYCLTGLGAYSLLVFGPEVLPQLSGLPKASRDEGLPQWLKDVSSPFAVALVLTALLPKVPWFKQGTLVFGPVPVRKRAATSPLLTRGSKVVDGDHPTGTYRLVRIG